jgi:hypothetical protein
LNPTFVFRLILAPNYLLMTLIRIFVTQGVTLWLQTLLMVREGFGAAMCPVDIGLRACPCVPKTLDIRFIIASSGAQCWKRIKCVCDRTYAAYD